MPFQSEKQRRFLWAEHPEIAKRWAAEYPNQKKLPMYANDKKPAESNEKDAALAVLRNVMAQVVNIENPLSNSILGRDTKVANSGMVKVDMPDSEKPTYAGQEESTTEQSQGENQPACESAGNNSSDPVEAVFGKLAAVLAKPLREMLETQQAMAEARDPRFVPQNMNLKRLSFPAATIAPPMGMAPPAPQTPAPQTPQPGNAQPGGPVGGGANPQHNPINAFGPLGAKGQLNGNAAFGQKNSPDSLKTAAVISSILDGQEKISIDVVQGGLPARAIASTIGHVGSFPGALVDPRIHQNASNWRGAGGSLFAQNFDPKDQRAQQLSSLAKDIARVRPQELSNTRVYLGGPRFLEEMRRGYTNPRTSLLGKAISTVGTPLNYGVSALTRGNAYNPMTDSVYQYANSPAILTHELGHAIDYNKSPVAKTFMGRQLQGLKRDAYMLAGRQLPPAVLRDEMAANSKSLQALQDTYKNNPGKLKPILNARQRVLPAAMGSYLGGTTFATAAGVNQAAKVLPKFLPKYAPHLGALASATNWANLTTPRNLAVLGGVGAGKLYGLARAARNKQSSDSGAWTRAEGKSESGGLNAKGRASLKAQGHDIKAPVTESNPKGERAGRQNSFCARMCGMKKHETGAKTKSDPDSRINKSLRKWNCKCGSALDLAVISGLEKTAVLDIIGHSLAPAMRKLTVARPPASLMQRATQMVTGKAPPVALSTKLKELAMNRVVKPGMVGLGMLGAGHDVANMAIQAPSFNHVTRTINGVTQPSKTLVNGVQVLRDSAPVALTAGNANRLATVGYKKPMYDILPGVTSRAGNSFNPVQAAQQFAQTAR